MDLASFLQSLDLVLDVELQHAQEIAQTRGRSLIQVLTQLGAIDDVKVARLLSLKLNLNLIDLDQRNIDRRALAALPADVARRARAIPVGFRVTHQGTFLYVALSDPTRREAFDTLAAAGDAEVIPLVAADSAIERALTRHYGPDLSTAGYGFGEGTGDIFETPVTKSGPPVVVGAILSEPEEFLTESTDATMRLYDPEHMAIPDKLPDVDLGRLDVDREAEEFLTASTNEVLGIYAPMRKATPIGQATTDDLTWLRQQQRGGRKFEPRPDDAPSSRVDPDGAAASRLAAPEPDEMDRDLSARFERAVDEETGGRDPGVSGLSRAERERRAAEAARSRASALVRQRLQQQGPSNHDDFEQAMRRAERTHQTQPIPNLASMADGDQGNLADTVPLGVPRPALEQAWDDDDPFRDAKTVVDEVADPPSDRDAASPTVSTVGLVCVDPEVRHWLVECLRAHWSQVVGLADLPGLLVYACRHPVAAAVVIHPVYDADFIDGVLAVQAIDAPPKLLVLSRNERFDDISGVTARVSFPENMDALPTTIAAHLSRFFR